jgi:hypothetical protein
MDAGEISEAKNHPDSRRLFADKTAWFDAMFHSSHPTCSSRDGYRCNLNFNSKMKCTPSSRRYAKITGVEVRAERRTRMKILGSEYIQPEIRVAS